MNPIRAIAEVFDAIQEIKNGASAYQTNFYPVRSRLEGWISRGELLIERTSGLTLFVRHDRDFGHGYFCGASPAALREGWDTLTAPRAEPLALDLVGAEAALSDQLNLFESSGFRRYAQLQRMARVGAEPPADGSGAVYAEGRHAGAMLAWLDRSFDRYAENLPDAAEIDAAILNRQILVVERGGVLAGMLFFETQGLTSAVRYWLVDERFRGQQIGGILMKQYLGSHPAVRRFILWVRADNAGAIAKYRHYGYASDGLVDHILVNERIAYGKSG